MKRRTAAALLAAALLVGAAPAAQAHVGSSTVVEEAQAGPYRLLVIVRPPDVVPGRAVIDVRVLDGDVQRVTVVPLPLVGPGRDAPPVPDEARASPADPRLFSAMLWLMRTGTWQVRITAEGAQGAGAFAVPVAALARTTRPMSPVLVALLIGLLGLLVAGLISIVGAAAREGDLLASAAPPDRARRRRGRVAMAVTAGLLVLALLGGQRWWRSEAALYRRLVYRPLVAEAQVDGNVLAVTLRDPGWLRQRKLDDLLPDHGHLMHLFLVREEDKGVVAHLHPARVAAGRFEQLLPDLPPGRYRLFADVVHASGLDETAVGTLYLSTQRPLQSPIGDDAVGLVGRAASAGAPVFGFEGGYTLRWVDPVPLRAGQPFLLTFECKGAGGPRERVLEPYMGMAGHAVFLAADFSVFAHVHPSGSVPMAALSLAAPGDSLPAGAHQHHRYELPARISFPYVFPRAGRYRLFVQVKLSGQIETAAFDLTVD
jgi:hypothetical protein